MKIEVLARRLVPMGDTERCTVVKFGLTSAMIIKYLATVCGSNQQSEVL